MTSERHPQGTRSFRESTKDLKWREACERERDLITLRNFSGILGNLEV